MTRSPEIYTPGYAEPTLRLMLQRTAAKHAAFFTPYLRGNKGNTTKRCSLHQNVRINIEGNKGRFRVDWQPCFLAIAYCLHQRCIKTLAEQSLWVPEDGQ